MVLNIISCVSLIHNQINLLTKNSEARYSKYPVLKDLKVYPGTVDKRIINHSTTGLTGREKN